MFWLLNNSCSDLISEVGFDALDDAILLCYAFRFAMPRNFVQIHAFSFSSTRELEAGVFLVPVNVVMSSLLLLCDLVILRW